MSKDYSITIDIKDVSFVDINEAQINNIRSKIEQNIRKTLDTRLLLV